MAAARLAVLILGLALLAPAGAVTPAGAPAWHELSAAQRHVLAPLEAEWATLDSAGRQTWIGVAERYEDLTPDEQARLQRRMREWARLSPDERERARDQYRALRSMPPEQRESLREEWQRYRSLPPEERRRRATEGSSR